MRQEVHLSSYEHRKKPTEWTSSPGNSAAMQRACEMVQVHLQSSGRRERTSRLQPALQQNSFVYDMFVIGLVYLLNLFNLQTLLQHCLKTLPHSPTPYQQYPPNGSPKPLQLPTTSPKPPTHSPYTSPKPTQAILANCQKLPQRLPKERKCFERIFRTAKYVQESSGPSQISFACFAWSSISGKEDPPRRCFGHNSAPWSRRGPRWKRILRASLSRLNL